MSSTIESISIPGTSSAAVLEPDTTEKSISGVAADLPNKKLKRNLNDWSESGSFDACLEKLESGLKKLSDDSIEITDEQLSEQKDLHELFAADWAGTSEQMVLIAELGAFDVILARNPNYLNEQQQKLKDIRELQRLEKIKTERNSAFKELFSVITGQLRLSEALIEEIQRLKEELKLTPAEKIIFDIVLKKLHEFSDELKRFSQPFSLSEEEYKQFQEKSEEEQVKFIEEAFSAGANTLETMEEMISSFDAILFYLDEIVLLYPSEIDILRKTDASALEPKFLTLSNKFMFSVRPFIMQTLTRLLMPVGKATESLQLRAEKEKLKAASISLAKLVPTYDEIRRKNVLFTNIFNAAAVSRNDFWEDADKAKAFKTFLAKKSDRKKKVAYFNLLRRISQSDSVSVIKENEKEIRRNFAFMTKALDELDIQRKDYVLNLPKIFPGYLDPAERKINLAKNPENGNLMYAVRGRDGAVVTGDIDIKIEGDLSLGKLDEIKKQILDEIVKQGHIIGEQEEEEQRKEKMRLAHNTIKSLLFDILEEDFSAFIEQAKNQIPNRRLTQIQRLSKMLSPKEIAELFGAVASDESVESIVPELKVTIGAKPDVSVSSMPELKVSQIAEKPDVSVLSKPEPRVTTAEKPDVSASSRSGLKRSASESQFGKAQLIRTSSLEKLSEVLGNVAQVTATKLESVKDTINRFAGKSTKLDAAISFDTYVDIALYNVQLFQRIANEQAVNTKADKAKFEGLEFTYKREADLQTGEKEEFFKGKIPTDSRDGDSAEIHHNGLLVCNIVAPKMSEHAKNVASGVSVTVHRHGKDDIDLAVRIMVQALAKAGKKKIIVTADLSSSEGRELALRYAKAILGQSAIPVLFDGERELSAKETKAKIMEMHTERYKATGDNSYRDTAEQYEETAKKIKREQKEDAIFIKAFDELMKMPVTTTSLFMKDPNPPRDILNVMDIANRLGDIALIRKNLTMDDYVDKLIDCLQKNYASDYAALTPDNLYAVKKQVKIYSARKIVKKPDILDRSPAILNAKIIDRSRRELQDSLFLKAFDDLLQDLATSSDLAIKMQDPSTGDELDAQQILTRLAQIAFVRNGMETEEFIDKVLAFGLATLVSSDAKEELREKIRLHLLHPKDERDEAKFAADLIEFAQTELLQDSLFLKVFDKFLRDIALSADIETKMQDPSTGDELNAQQILTRLAEIAFVRNGMEPEEFIDRAITFGLATLAPLDRAAVTDQHMEDLKEDLKKELREKIRLHLLHDVEDRDEAVFAADLIKFAQQKLLPGQVAKNSKFYSLFPRLGSSCAEEDVSSQQAMKAISSQQPVLVGTGHNG